MKVSRFVTYAIYTLGNVLICRPIAIYELCCAKYLVTIPFWLEAKGNFQNIGLHQIPSASWIYHSLHFHIYQIASFIPGILCPLCCYYRWWGNAIGRRWLIYNRMREGGTGGGYYLVVFVFAFSIVLLTFVFSCPLSLFLSD